MEGKKEAVSITGYRFCDMELLNTAFSSMRCADCLEFRVLLMENNGKGKDVLQAFAFFARIADGKTNFSLPNSKPRVLR